MPGKVISTMLSRSNTRGFTLIELMMVVVVIGIIVAITIPNYMKFTKRAKEAVVQENVHTIQLAMEAYCVDQLGLYPEVADEADLLALMPLGQYPENPFTKAVTTIAWEQDPANPGDVSIFNLPGGGYMLRAQGSTALMDDIVVGD